MMSTPDSVTTLELQPILRALPGLYLIVSPDFTILEATDAYLQSTYKDRSIIGKQLFEVFPDNPSVQEANGVLNLRQSLEYARDHKVPHKMAIQRYDVTNSELLGGGFEEKYWEPLNTPVLDASGEVQYLIHNVVDVTKEEKAKNSSEIAQNSLRAIVAATGGVSWEYDIESKKFYWSQNLEQMFGYVASKDGESPNAWDEKVHPSDYAALKQSIKDCIQKKDRVWTGTYRFKKADGSYTRVIDHGFILYSNTGEPYRMMGTMIDADYQESRDHQTRTSLERFELMAKATNDVIWDWNLTNDSIWWNEGFKVTFGYKDEDIEHDVNSWYGRIHPEDAERVVHGIHEVIDGGGSSWQDEYRFKKADGTYAEILDRGFIARDGNGEPLRMIGAMLDITEKNRIAAELKANAEHVRALLESIPEVAWVARADGYIYYFNRAWYEYTGNTNPEQGWENLVHPEDWPSLAANWKNSLETGQMYVQQARLKQASDGQYQWFAMRATPLHDEEGNIQAWIGVDTNIQEQIEIQHKLRERDEYVQRMLAQAPVQFAVLKGDDWMVDFITPQFKSLIGGRDIVGKPYRQALPELEEQGFFNYIENVYATGELFRGRETPAYLDRKGDGNLELGYFDFIYQPLFNEQHKVEGVMMLIVEVTEQVRVRKEAEKLTEELKVSHERTLKVLEAIPHMTFTAKVNGDIDYYNPRWYEFLGSTSEHVLGWGWENFIHPEDLETTKTAWVHSISCGEPFTMENRWRSHETGKYHWFLVRAVPLYDQEGKISMWVGTHTDIQEQRQMLLALEESNRHFQFLAESMPQLVWTTDASGYHEYFNQRWVDFTGFSVEESRGIDIWNKLLHPEDRERAAERWQHSLQTGEPYEIEYRFQRASDHNWRWFLARALPLRDQDGVIIKWFGTCTDIEDQKQNEELMEQTNRELRSINEDLDSFVYTASHDLKLPIINMGGVFNELTRSATFDDPESEILIKMFNKSLNQIQGTIDDLSEIVKVQKNIDAQREEVKLSELVEEVKLSIQEMIQSSNGQVICHFDEVPTITFSRVNLKSVFYNLISNGIKYRSMQRTPVVTLTTRQEGEFTVLTVKDNGIGIDMEKHGAKVFQMFKRFHNHVPGSGLGLYIINRIIQKNGGHIEVQSAVEEGTTFTIYIKNADL